MSVLMFFYDSVHSLGDWIWSGIDTWPMFPWGAIGGFLLYGIFGPLGLLLARLTGQ